MTVGWLVVLLVLAAAAVAIALRRSELQGAAAVLRLLAVLFAGVVAVAVFPVFWDDSGGHAIWALGLPVLVALLPVLAAGSRVGVVVTWLAAAFLLGWSLVFGLGFGLYLLPAALAETAAAVTQRRPSFP